MMLDELKALVAVIDHNSITGAANALSLTQSAISRRIQQLEESLGATLFDRNSKPPRATALAHRVYADALPLLRGFERLQGISREGSPPSGVFRLGLTHVLAELLLFDTIVRMKASFPLLEVNLQSAWSSRLQLDVEQGNLDAATLMLPFETNPPASLGGKYITTLDIVIVQSRAAPLVARTGDSAALAALAAHDWILNPFGCGYRAALERAMASAGKPLKLSVDSHGTDMQLRLVAAGLGLGLVPKSVLAQSPYRRRLAVLDVGDFALKLDVWLVHPHQMGNLTQATALVSEAMIAGLKK